MNRSNITSKSRQELQDLCDHLKQDLEDAKLAHSKLKHQLLNAQNGREYDHKKHAKQIQTLKEQVQKA